MPRTVRKRSESDIYHVMVRGAGKHILFEDDEDRECFLRMLSKAIDAYGASAYAWCLMSNHVHILVKADFDRLPRLMQSITSGYAVYYNKKYDHVGHVFGGRYNSKPVDSDEYLMQLVRYIHLNPVEDGLSNSCSYQWSSYDNYLDRAGFCDTAFVLDVFGGKRQFESFHEDLADDRLMQTAKVNAPRTRLGDAEALDVAKAALGAEYLSMLGSFAKDERDAGIAALRQAGLSARQVERFTGIGRGIVERIKWK